MRFHHTVVRLALSWRQGLGRWRNRAFGRVAASHRSGVSCGKRPHLLHATKIISNIIQDILYLVGAYRGVLRSDDVYFLFRSREL